MKYAICLGFLLVFTAVTQIAVVPAMLPAVLRPDLGIIVAMTLLAMAPREFGLFSIFAMGLQADLISSSRFGLLTLCYMLAAGLILLCAWRELTRGDLLAAWVGGIAATLLAHGLYIGLARMCGYETSFAQAWPVLLSLVIGGTVWGLLIVAFTGRWMQWTNTLDHAVRERWAAEARLSAARRGIRKD